MENGFKVVDPPLYEKVVEKPKQYRVYACLHLVLMLSFFGYRLLNPLDESYVVWILAFACDLWFAFQWILECNLRWLLVHYRTYPENGIQGPPYCGTGCFHRRKASYGVPPATNQHSNKDVRESGDNVRESGDNAKGRLFRRRELTSHILGI